MTATRLGFSHQFHNRIALETKQPGTLPGYQSSMVNMPSDFYWSVFAVCFSIKFVRDPRSGKCPLWSGAEGIRTPDLLRAREALSQLSYGPAIIYARSPVSVGLSGLEPETFPLSEGCSNQLS